MAVTATPYQAAFTGMILGNHVYSMFTVALLADSYVPDMINHRTFDAVVANEISGDGYGFGGQQLYGLVGSPEPAGTADGFKISSDPVVWTGLTASVRYAVIYTNRGNPSQSWLLGLIDFGAVRVYNNETFELSFPDGLITLSKQV